MLTHEVENREYSDLCLVYVCTEALWQDTRQIFDDPATCDMGQGVDLLFELLETLDVDACRCQKQVYQFLSLECVVKRHTEFFKKEFTHQ
ncbi:hypothetical protein D3C81_1933400 [compost metagenome]